MLEELKTRVCEANLSLVEFKLVLFTWGNVSAQDDETGLVVIKPSGVSYETMAPEDMVVVDMDGEVVEGSYKPSSDTLTHLEIYRHFKGVGGVVHTHSKWATIWAQAETPLPSLGTTHADNFFGAIPCTRKLTPEEIRGEYEKETGIVIVETFQTAEIDPLEVQAVLVANHGPFTWGKTPEKAVENAAVLEYVAELAYFALKIQPNASMSPDLLTKHYTRKHGKSAYYGQE
jgi:L-ribulose-5-phosphate 4-epimerase